MEEAGDVVEGITTTTRVVEGELQEKIGAEMALHYKMVSSAGTDEGTTMMTNITMTTTGVHLVVATPGPIHAVEGKFLFEEK